jgi:hypothetical protein
MFINVNTAVGTTHELLLVNIYDKLYQKRNLYRHGIYNFMAIRTIGIRHQKNKKKNKTFIDVI